MPSTDEHKHFKEPGGDVPSLDVELHSPKASPKTEEMSVEEQLINSLNEGNMLRVLQIAAQNYSAPTIHSPALYEALDVHLKKLSPEPAKLEIETLDQLFLNLHLTKGSLATTIPEDTIEKITTCLALDCYSFGGTCLERFLELATPAQSIREAAFQKVAKDHQERTYSRKPKTFLQIIEYLQPESLTYPDGKLILAEYIRDGFLDGLGALQAENREQQIEVANALVSYLSIENNFESPQFLTALIDKLKLPGELFHNEGAQEVGKKLITKMHRFDFKEPEKEVQHLQDLFALSETEVFNALKNYIQTCCDKMYFDRAWKMLQTSTVTDKTELQDIYNRATRDLLGGGSFRDKTINFCKKFPGAVVAASITSASLLSIGYGFTGATDLQSSLYKGIGILGIALAQLLGATVQAIADNDFYRDASYPKLCDIPVSENVKKDRGVQKTIRKNIKKLLKAGDVASAMQLANEFEIKPDQQWKKSVSAPFLKSFRYDGAQIFINSIKAFVSFLEFSKEEREALARRKDFVSLANYYFSSRPAQSGQRIIQELADALELDEQHTKRLAATCAMKHMDFRKGAQSLGFYLIEKFSLRPSDFQGKLEPHIHTHVQDILRANCIFSLHRYVTFLGEQASTDILNNETYKKQILHIVKSLHCPDTLGSMPELFDLFSLSPQCLSPENAATLKTQAKTWCHEHIAALRLQKAIVVARLFDVELDEFTDAFKRERRYMIDGMTDASLQMVLKAFGAKLAGSLSEELENKALLRAFEHLCEGERESALLITSSFGISEASCYEYAKICARLFIQDGKYRKIFSSLEPWGIDEHTTIAEIFPIDECPELHEFHNQAGRYYLGEFLEYAQSIRPESKATFFRSDRSYTSAPDAEKYAQEDTAVSVTSELPFYSQQRSFACAAGSARMVLKALTGSELTEKKIMRTLGTTFEDGTPLRNFQHIPEHFPDIECIVEQNGELSSLKELMQKGYILIVNYSPFGPHYGVIKTIAENALVLNDPIRGENLIMPKEAFLNCWHGGYETTELTNRGYVALRLKGDV